MQVNKTSQYQISLDSTETAQLAQRLNLRDFESDDFANNLHTAISDVFDGDEDLYGEDQLQGENL